MPDLPPERQFEEERDAWWGSYSPWTMTPSLVVCILLTGAITWGAWHFLQKNLVHLTVLSLGGAVWLWQTTRWLYRLFGFNYRLTNRRLFLDRGLLYPERIELCLTSIARVEVLQNQAEKLVHVGRVRLSQKNGSPIVLEGIPHPHQVARMIQELSEKATSHSEVRDQRSEIKQ